MNATFVSIITGTLGKFSKRFASQLKELEFHFEKRINIFQITALLKSIRLVRKALEFSEDMLSLNLS